MAKLHLFRCSLGACINEYAEKTSLILSINERAQSLSLSLSLSLSPSPSFFLRSPLSQCSKYSFFFPSFLSFLLDAKVLSRRHEYLTKTKYSHMFLCAAHNGTIISSTIIASSSSSSSSSSRGRRQRPEKSFWTTTTIKTRTSICLQASSSSSNNNEEKEEEEDIFEVIRENLPFFIGGMVAGTFGLSITDDSSPLKGWVEDRRKSSMSSLSQNINKLVDPPSPSAIRIRQEEEAVFTVPTTKTTLENNNNDNISSTE